MILLLSFDNECMLELFQYCYLLKTWCWNRLLWDMNVPVEKTAIYCFDIAMHSTCELMCSVYNCKYAMSCHALLLTRQLILVRMRAIMTHPGVEWEVSEYLTYIDNRQIVFFNHTKIIGYNLSFSFSFFSLSSFFPMLLRVQGEF